MAQEVEPGLVHVRYTFHIDKHQELAMAKTGSCKMETSSSARLSPSAELRVLKKIAATLKKEPAKVRELTVSAGIFTADGKLRKAFGGKA